MMMFIRERMRVQRDAWLSEIGHKRPMRKGKTLAEAKDGSTELSLKSLVPVRIYKNAFYDRVKEAEARGASKEELAELLGRGRAKKGIFLGDLEEGEIEFGQIASSISESKPVKEIIEQLVVEYEQAVLGLPGSLLSS